MRNASGKAPRESTPYSAATRLAAAFAEHAHGVTAVRAHARHVLDYTGDGHRLDLSNGMRLAALTDVTDDSRNMLGDGLEPRRRLPPWARTDDVSVISALPFAL